MLPVLETMNELNTKLNKAKVTNKNSIPWIAYILLLGILMLGAYFRFVGLDWDDDQHLHPDERFLTMVETAIQPVHSLSEYFDTEHSTLNPHNVGYTFYVYGTLPIFIVRYLAGAIGKIGYGQVYLVGRAVSGIFDLLTVILVFFVSYKIYHKYRLSLVAAAFMAFAVLPIQLSHYFTVDVIANFFSFLTIACAVLVMTANQDEKSELAAVKNEDEFTDNEVPVPISTIWKSDKTLVYFVLFGLAFGMALASKVSTAPLVLTLFLACVIYTSRVPHSQRRLQSTIIFRNLVVAGFVTILIFRIFQPYAFSGPGFFGILPNEKWIANMRELSAQSGGDVDFPPALQWARRPITFAWTNMVKWGLGLPLGLLAWAGFLYMGWRIIRKDWRQHLLLWGWTGVYFAWQSLNFTRSMRYQIPIYPTLVIIAAWLIFELWQTRENWKPAVKKISKVASVVLGVGVLVGTLAWAYAFTRIYTRPVTRIEASRWIYQNVNSALNFKVETQQGIQNFPVAMRNDMQATVEKPIVQAFRPEKSATLVSLQLTHVVNTTKPNDIDNLVVIISEYADGSNRIAAGLVSAAFAPGDDPRGSSYLVELNAPVAVEKDKQYYIVVQPVASDSIFYLAGSTELMMVDSNGTTIQYLPELVTGIRPDQEYTTIVSFQQSGTLNEMFIPRAVDWEASPGKKDLSVTIKDPDSGEILTKGTIQNEFGPGIDVRGDSYTVQFTPALTITQDKMYTVSIAVSDGTIAFYGDKQAIESSWDDSLPYPMDGYNPFDYYTGIYRSDLNFEVYWDDNTDKLKRMESILNQADYLFISSNRQYATTVRVPERYPLTTEYYRQLMGCPEDKDLVWCYNVAKPGMFQGNLGFELAAVFQSNPNLGNLEFNTQFAEEAFTVYDAPKVLIFKKTSDYDAAKTASILEAVDLTQVVHLTPRQASKYHGNLLLSKEDQVKQQTGGTWSEIFNRNSILNKVEPIGVIAWYLVIMLVGWLVTPWLRLGLWGLPDKGYPFARIFGLLLVASLVWLAGSAGIPFTRLTITLAILFIALISGVLLFIQRDKIRQDIKQNWRYYLTVEFIFLALFITFLMVRLGNPDLWHPYKGGEKPMDLSYFTAVLKSTTFPPYDPWFEGGYLNYYYYGFVIVGVLVKWLGLIPTFAYNLILPTLFAMTGIGAFSIGWNLLSKRRVEIEPTDIREWWRIRQSSLIAGISSTFAIILIGNLGTVRQIWQGIMRLAPGVDLATGSFIDRLRWTFQGMVQFIGGATLPYGRGDWYWIPSRVYPNEPITEFPLFTFLYADLHAHLISLSITLLVIVCCIAFLKGRLQTEMPGKVIRWLQYGMALFISALALGALKPTNTWDMPTYMIFAGMVLLYGALRYLIIPNSFLKSYAPWLKRVGIAVLMLGALLGLSFLLYLPFSRHFGTGYTAFDLWKGEHSPFWSYFTHWGLFLVVIFTWLYWETHQWLANTPATALKKFLPYRDLLWLGAAVVIIVVIVLLAIGIQIAWLVVPMILWTGILILRLGISDNKRLVLFMILTGLLLTLAVELVVLRGDIGRMNSVFKFYYQAWTMLSLSAAASFTWLIPEINNRWKEGWRITWQLGMACLVASAFLFTMLATTDKITDRISDHIPVSLDGMTYMQVSTYNDMGNDLDLSADYRAIQWMQENVKGSPVIVEANTTEYRWGSRFTIYTGLPGVVGWNWHQRQQRAVTPQEWVTDRVAAINDFYMTEDRQLTTQFLQRYNVKYIIVGKLERSLYPALSLAKFELWNNDLWQDVYRDGDTVIYQVK